MSEARTVRATRGGSPPLAAETGIAEVAQALRTGGFTLAGPVFDRLAAALIERVSALGAPALAALTRARERQDAIVAADLLDGEIAPRLGRAGSLGGQPRTVALDQLEATEGALPRIRSVIDAAAEARLQLNALASTASGPIALLGGTSAPIASLLADLPTTHPLLLWDPAHTSSSSVPTGRPVLWILEESVRPEPAAAIWIHPSLRGPERRRAERIRARLRGLRPVSSRPPLDPARALRAVVLVRPRPFHLDAPLTGTLRSLGHATAVLTVHGDERDEATAETLTNARPDLVLSVNGAALAVSPPLRAALNVAEIPTALWFVDDPELALGEAIDLAAPHILAFAWEREAVARLRARGFGGARHLPHGTRWNGDPPVPLAGSPELLWIGSSYAGADRRSLHAGAARPDAAWIAIEARLRADRRLAPSALRATLPGPDSVDRRFAQLRAADAVAARRRAEVAAALRPLGLTIFGDVDGWRSLLGSGHGLLPDVDAVQVAPFLVGGARISVDCVHPQMPTAVTQRVFDVPACGGLVLADDRPDLREFFEVGTEVLAYDGADEAADLARWALAHPEHRRRIAAAARRRVLAEHRLEHRVRLLLQRAAERFGLRRPLG